MNKKNPSQNETDRKSLGCCAQIFPGQGNIVGQRNWHERPNELILQIVRHSDPKGPTAMSLAQTTQVTHVFPRAKNNSKPRKMKNMYINIGTTHRGSRTGSKAIGPVDKNLCHAVRGCFRPWPRE